MASNVPRLPRWTDEDVIRELQTCLQKALTTAEMYDALCIVETFRPRLFRELLRYIRRRYASSPTFLEFFDREVKKARQRSQANRT